MPTKALPVTTQPKTLLTLLLEQGLLTDEQAALLPASATNAVVEQTVVAQGLVTLEQVLQAYAQLYQLPFIHLTDETIDAEAVRLIPEIVARRYDLVAYQKDAEYLYVAMSAPSKLKESMNGGLLHRIQDQLKLKIAPAFALTPEIRQSFAHYAKPAVVAQPSGTTLPSISLQSMEIAPAVLQKFPREIAEKYQVIAFAEPQPGQLKVAAVRPEQAEVQELFRFIQTKNNIQLEQYTLPEAEFVAALQRYGGAPTATSAPVAPGNATAEATTKTQVFPETQLPGEKAGLSMPRPKVTNDQSIQEITPEATPSLATHDIVRQKISEDINQHNRDLLTSPTLPDNRVDPTIAGNLEAELGQPVTSVNDLMQIARSGNVPRFVASMLALAILSRASDIHIEATKKEVRIRYRIDGELDDILLLPHELLAPIVSRIKILSELKIDENRIPQDGRFDVKLSERDVDLRVSTMPTVHGEKVVLRILDKTNGVMRLADMGIDGNNLVRIEENIRKPYGVVLATGPTGSGKSTTLYAGLQEISKPEVNIITLEDPVEYELKGINQTQIKPKIGFTFAEGLRSILRQDPNVIMVGEIRDAETAEMVTHAALTGHLVLSTLHTNNAAGAIPRLINMGVEPFLITSSINAIIGQRLVRRVCPSCKEEVRLPQDVIEEINQELKDSHVPDQYKDPSTWHFYRGKGCPQCHNGYRGRIGLFEVLVMSEAIEELAIKKSPESVIEERAIAEGMMTLKQDGLLKAIEGLTTVEEVLKATTE